MKNLLILFLVFCISCKEQVKHGKPRAYSIANAKTDSVILILNNATCINGAAVGVAGARTAEWDSYEWLLKNGTDSLLVALANYPNPYTRTYAFMALCKRKNPVARQIFEKNLADTTTINTMDGCIVSTCPLNQIWYSKAHPLLDSTTALHFAKKINPDYPQMRVCIIPD